MRLEPRAVLGMMPVMTNMNLDGRVAAVTGAARGIGAGVARKMIAAGMRVAVGDVDYDVAQATARELGPNARAYRLDVADERSFAAFLEHAEAELGPLDVLVNNAGIMPAGAFLDETPASTRRQVDINVFGVINGCRLVLPRFIDRGRGQVISVSSAAGRNGFAGIATYSGTKFFVYGFCDALRPELAGTGVHVTVVMPGFVQTELTSGFGDARWGRKVTPDEVAKAVLGAVRDPRFEVFVPKALGPMVKFSNLLPARLRDSMTKLAGADRIALDYDRARRAGYENRAANSHPIELEPAAESTTEV
jgi:NADP-dependent 3-hydroxy acid dehydrogenase YdfG